jgi:hypothetical protein
MGSAIDSSGSPCLWSCWRNPNTSWCIHLCCSRSASFATHRDPPRWPQWRPPRCGSLAWGFCCRVQPGEQKSVLL